MDGSPVHLQVICWEEHFQSFTTARNTTSALSSYLLFIIHLVDGSPDHRLMCWWSTHWWSGKENTFRGKYYYSTLRLNIIYDSSRSSVDILIVHPCMHLPVTLKLSISNYFSACWAFSSNVSRVLEIFTKQVLSTNSHVSFLLLLTSESNLCKR